MKKLLLSLLASVLLFSGCSLFGDENKTMSKEDALKMAQENPSELFYTLAKANSEYMSQESKKYMPSKETLQRYTSEFSDTVSFDLTNTPMGGGKGNYAFSMQSEGDYTNLADQKQKTDFSLVSDIMGGMFTSDIKGTFLVLEKAIFLQFEKSNISMMMMPAEVKTAVSSLAGKTFGNTWEEIKTLSQGEFNLEKYFTSGGFWLAMLSYVDEVKNNPQDFLTFQKFIKEENGYFYFEVVQNPEGTKKVLSLMKSILPFGADFEAEMDTAMEEAMKNSSAPIMIAYNPENRKYMIEEVSVPNGAENIVVTMKYIENEMSLSVPVEPGVVLSLEKKGDMIEGRITEATKQTVFVKGTANKDVLVLDFLHPDDASVLAHADFKRSGKSWGGEISSSALESMDPMFAGLKVVFSDCTWSAEKITATIQVKLKDAVALTGEWKYSIKKASGLLDIAKPQTVSPFADMATVFESLNTLSESTDSANPPAMTEEEMQALQSEFDAMSPEEKAALGAELQKMGLPQ